MLQLLRRYKEEWDDLDHPDRLALMALGTILTFVSVGLAPIMLLFGIVHQEIAGRLEVIFVEKQIENELKNYRAAWEE